MEHRCREPAPGVFRLSLPLPWEALGRVNAYLLRDPQGSTLVDCGIWFPADKADHGWDDLVAALRTCEASPQEVKRLVVTHTHIDHYGMAGRFVEETGAELWMHRASTEDLEIYRDPKTAEAELRKLFENHGVRGEELGDLTQFEDWRAFVHSVVEADVLLDGDERFECGGRTWRTIYTPGHARSHVCLWDEEGSLLLSGDHLLPTITPHIDFRTGEKDPLGDFIESLGKVESLAPQLVLPGHGRPFEDGAERARVIARHHDRRLGAVIQIVRNEPHTANEITDELFGTTLLNFERRLALGEALAHIAHLLRNGEIEATENDDGTFVYQKVQRRRHGHDGDDA